MDNSQIGADFKKNGTTYTTDQLLDYLSSVKKMRDEHDPSDVKAIERYEEEIAGVKIILARQTNLSNAD